MRLYMTWMNRVLKLKGTIMEGGRNEKLRG